MFDLKIAGGEVVDGTGSRCRGPAHREAAGDYNEGRRQGPCHALGDTGREQRATSLGRRRERMVRIVRAATGTSRRAALRGALALPAVALLASCGQAATGGGNAAPAPNQVKGKVLALAYQMSSPGFDR